MASWYLSAASSHELLLVFCHSVNLSGGFAALAGRSITSELSNILDISSILGPCSHLCGLVVSDLIDLPGLSWSESGRDRSLLVRRLPLPS